MKKFTVILSLVIALSMMASMFMIGAFATDAESTPPLLGSSAESSAPDDTDATNAEDTNEVKPEDTNKANADDANATGAGESQPTDSETETAPVAEDEGDDTVLVIAGIIAALIVAIAVVVVVIKNKQAEE